VFTDSVAGASRKGRHDVPHSLQAGADLQRQTPVAKPLRLVRLKDGGRPFLGAVHCHAPGVGLPYRTVDAERFVASEA
jgi:hypothetical protein